MQYSAKFRHIDQDFAFEGLEFGSWNAEYDNEEEFILALNRMAIATSQHPVVEFPEVEVKSGTTRVTIHSIEGQLYYTDLHSQNRKNLKVVPIEIVRLIEGRPLDEVFKQDEEEEDVYEPPQREYRPHSNPFTKFVSLALMLIILACSVAYIWLQINYEPRLITAPTFIPSLSEEGEVLRKYADVYVSEYREGAMLFELTRQGTFTRYEMWFSEERNAFILLKVDSYPVQVGTHGGETAILAGEKHLLNLVSEEAIVLHGIQFKRHHDVLASIGEVLSK